MNDLTETHSAAWENDEIRVDVLFSAAGVATNMAMVSKVAVFYLLTLAMAHSETCFLKAVLIL